MHLAPISDTRDSELRDLGQSNYNEIEEKAECEPQKEEAQKEEEKA